MSRRVGLGPVFALEWLITTRRWQVYALRSLFVAVLLASLSAVWWSQVAGKSLETIQAQAAVGQVFYYAIVGTQLVLVLLAAPAATAGAICQEKAGGSLTHLLVTDLSDAEIVLGKLAARLAPVFGLTACALPVMALGTLLGGIDPVALTGAFLVSLGTATVGCSLALLLSVWGTRTHEVLLSTYFLLLIWVLAGPVCFVLRTLTPWGWWLPGWFTESNPFRITLARPGPGHLAEPVLFLAATCVLSGLLTAVAIVRLRAAAARGGEVRARPRQAPARRGRTGSRWRFLPGPSLDGNPVLWREWHRRRPTRWGRILWTSYALVAGILTVVAIDAAFRGNINTRAMSSVFTGGQVALGFLFLSVSSSTSLAEERARGSLDVLLTTPLSTASIIRGKWWGTYRGTLLVAIPPLLVSCALAAHSGRWSGVYLVVGLVLAYGAALTSLGLALATWIPRVGRAMAWTVAADVGMTVGWMFLIVALVSRGCGATGPGLASASPFMGTVYPLILMSEKNMTEWDEARFWLLFWIFIDTAVSALLLRATRLSFDDCLGRLSEAAPCADRPAPFFLEDGVQKGSTDVRRGSSRGKNEERSELFPS